MKHLLNRRIKRRIKQRIRILISAPVICMIFFGCSRNKSPAGADTEHQSVRDEGARTINGRSQDGGPPKPSINVAWQPDTGRGAISITTEARHKMEIRLQDRFDGYTGGLYLGSMNRPAFTLFRPGLDKKPVAIWCAQDESIWDHARQVEFSPGWSENFGHGPDGRHLRYSGGRIVETSATSVLLASSNRALPYEVSKWMAVHIDGMMVVRTRIRNISRKPVTFDLWSGDDPWVGDYGTSRGDVGWHNGHWIKAERKIDMSTARCAGIADLQNGKWKTANYMCLHPDAPLPSAGYFANRFAHSDADISPHTPLNAQTMTAFNLGWQNISLNPNDTFELSYAIGPISNNTVRNGASTPSPPVITQKRWRQVRAAADIVAASPADAVRFKSERVEMHLLPGKRDIRIVGAYTFENRVDKKQFRQIYFPFAIDDRHPYPHHIDVEELRFQRFRKGILFPLTMGPKETRTVRLSYEQKSKDNSATYIVTSARTWNAPLDESVLTVESPDCNPKIDISYPMIRQKRPGGCHYETTLRPFWPTKEFTVRWADKGDTP